MKRCQHCKTLLPLSEFSKDKHESDGVQGNCKKCVRVYHKKYYTENKERYLLGIRKNEREIKNWYINYKSTLVCIICGEDDPICLDFHHRNPSKKEVNITTAIRDCWSRSRILKELEKCDIVCSNCHRKIHRDLLKNNF